MSDRVNPYEAPSVLVLDAPEGTGKPLAGRGRRLAASILDGVIYAIGPLILVMIIFPPSSFEDPSFLLSAYAAAIPAILVNLYFLWRSGQSLGKKVLKIQIVRTDQSRASLGRIFLLRLLAPSLLGAIPIAGPFFALANVLFIFGEARRCIHDYMADTIVIQLHD